MNLNCIKLTVKFNWCYSTLKKANKIFTVFLNMNDVYQAYLDGIYHWLLFQMYPRKKRTVKESHITILLLEDDIITQIKVLTSLWHQATGSDLRTNFCSMYYFSPIDHVYANTSFFFHGSGKWDDIWVYIPNWWYVQCVDKSWPILLESHHERKERKKFVANLMVCGFIFW